MLASASLHDTFLSLLPTIERYARVFFRHTRCKNRFYDQLAEVSALAWKWFVRLAKRGKDATRFPAVLARYACRAVRCGRRLNGQERAKDVMSSLAQRRHGFTVESLPVMQTCHDDLYGRVDGQRRHDEFEERLHDNMRTPVPDQAAFRIDFPAWLRTMTARERRLIKAMARNETTNDLSKQFRVSPGRISQLRREFHEGWQMFCGDTAAETSAAVA